VLLLVARTVTRFYGDDVKELWSWVAQLLFPVLSLIVAAWTVGGAHSDSRPIRSAMVFWGTLLLSLFYVATLYLVVGLEPLSPGDWLTVFRSSGWYLGLFQGIVIGALGKFFIENKGTGLKPKK
jgi:hypothetical protein